MKHIVNKLAQFTLIVGLSITFNQSIKARSALDGFDPNANATVFAFVSR